MVKGSLHPAAWLCDEALTQDVEMHYYLKGHCLGVIYLPSSHAFPTLNMKLGCCIHPENLMTVRCSSLLYLRTISKTSLCEIWREQ